MKKFTMRDEEFICENCGRMVSVLKYSARDHCPFCLCSKHVDIMPGDRQNTCLGIFEPVGIEKFKDTYKIVYRCRKCGEFHRNIMAKDDDMDLIISLSSNQY